MIKLTNPLNRDGILYEKGAILTLSLKDEQELITNGLAEAYPPLKTDKGIGDEVNKDNNKVDEPEEVKASQADKEVKKTSTRIGRTAKK